MPEIDDRSNMDSDILCAGLIMIPIIIGIMPAPTTIMDMSFVFIFDARFFIIEFEIVHIINVIAGINIISYIILK